MAIDTKEEHESAELQRKRLEIVSAILAEILYQLGVLNTDLVRGTDLVLAAETYLKAPGNDEKSVKLREILIDELLSKGLTNVPNGYLVMPHDIDRCIRRLTGERVEWPD